MTPRMRGEREEEEPNEATERRRREGVKEEEEEGPGQTSWFQVVLPSPPPR